MSFLGTLNIALSVYCPLPCTTMGINFGIPIVSTIDINPDQAYLKLYFKNQINVRRSVSSYSISSLVADIGGYLGLLLGFSLLDLSMIIKNNDYLSYFWVKRRPSSIKPTREGHPEKEKSHEKFEKQKQSDMTKDLASTFVDMSMVGYQPIVNDLAIPNKE